MADISKQELLDTIAANPMICTRSIIKKLRPEDFDNGERYKAELDAVKPLLMELWEDGKIISSKVQCCTFNLKQWQIVGS